MYGFSGSRGNVALLAEGVDRNCRSGETKRPEKKSPSSRRAWIEMGRLSRTREIWPVALLAEGVDRNWNEDNKPVGGKSRPPRGGRG